MKKSTELHLESISAEVLIEWKRNDAFVAFASCVGGNVKSVELGVGGNGHYVVRHWENGELRKESFTAAKFAIQRYSELLS